MARICIENIALVTQNEICENYCILLQDETIEAVFPLEQKPVLKDAVTVNGVSHPFPVGVNLT